MNKLNKEDQEELDKLMDSLGLTPYHSVRIELKNFIERLIACLSKKTI